MKLKDFFTYFGISLSLVGVPLGMYFNYLFPIIPWSPVFMFASVVLIFSFRNLFLGKLPLYNRIFALIVFFQSLMLIYGVLSTNLTFQYLTFHLYIISLVFALSSNENTISYTKIIQITFYVSAICSFLGAFFMWKGLIVGEYAWQLRQDNENYALEQFTVAGGAITNLICAICFRAKNKVLKGLIALVLLLDFYIILSSGKRTPIFVTLIILIIYFYKMGVLNKRLFYNYFKFLFFLLVILVILYNYNTSFEKNIDNFFIHFYNGFLNILGDKTVTDGTGSAIARFQARNWTYQYIEDQFNFFNYLLGAGYMTRWIDNPLLQSFLDMGILGFMLYTYLIILFPIKSFFKVNNLLSLFAVLLCVYNIMATYSSGNPYFYIKYVPIVFLAFIINLKMNIDSHFNKIKN